MFMSLPEGSPAQRRVSEGGRGPAHSPPDWTSLQGHPIPAPELRTGPREAFVSETKLTFPPATSPAFSPKQVLLPKAPHTFPACSLRSRARFPDNWPETTDTSRAYMFTPVSSLD